MIAAPLILPFAELAGITIAGLSMAAASQKVGDFISDNPELSKQILTTLLPGGVGLNTLFKKEAGITLEDVEEMTDEEAADLSKEDKAEIMKEVGKSKGGNKRQRMIEISEKLGLSGEGKEKQTIVDEVEERYDEGGVEDAPKPKFNYKKFFRNRRADGGAIGIEVLFEEKKDGGRIGFANGGDNIIGSTIDKFFSGPAYDKYSAERTRAYTEAPSRLSYNIDANKAAGQFIQDRTKELLGDNPVSNVIGQRLTYAAVPVAFMASPFHEGAQVVEEGRMEPGSGVKGFTKAFLDEDPFITAAQRAGGVLQSTPLGETIYNIGGKAADLVSGIRNTNIGNFFSAPAVAADLPGGGGGGGGEGPTTVRADYERAPNTAFAELLAQTPTPQSLNQFDNIINTGVNQRPRLTDRIKSGIETVGNKLGSFGDYIKGGGIFGNIISGFGSRGDQSTRGIAGLNLQDVFNIDSFGSDEDPTKDPYGINIVSRFGNYKDYVTQKARELAQRKFRTDSANKRKDFYQQAFEKIQEQQRIEQAAQRARDKLRSEAAYATQTGDDSPYTGGFDPSTGNYDDPFSPGDTE